jgi:hypothetical protein
MDDAGRIVLGPASRELRRALRPIEWVVLEDVALDARPDGAGALVAPTSARRVAEHLGLTPGAVAGALGRLRSAGLITHARQAGPAGRFGLSAYVLGPVAGLDVVDVADATDGPPPRPAPPRVDRPRAVGAPMVGSAVDADRAPDAARSARRSRPDPVPAVAASAGRPAEDHAHPTGGRSAARRGRRPVSQPGIVQLALLDTPDDTDAARHS